MSAISNAIQTRNIAHNMDLALEDYLDGEFRKQSIDARARIEQQLGTADVNDTLAETEPSVFPANFFPTDPNVTNRSVDDLRNQSLPNLFG